MYDTIISFSNTQQFLNECIANKKKQLAWLESKELYEECSLKLKEIKELETLLIDNQ